MKNPTQDIILQELKVKDNNELLPFLETNEVRKSRNAIKSLLAHKQININGKVITQFNFALKPGDIVRIMKHNQERKRNKLKGATIEYEDDYLIIVNKDPGMLSVSTDKEKSRTVYNILNEYVRKKNKRNRVYVLHRLDREISGLMVFAKNQDIQSLFQNNWDKLIPVFTYIAVVEGSLQPPAGKITSWLTEDKNYVMRASLSDNGGLESTTDYKTLKSNGEYSLLSFKLVTRRKNQVRSQMKLIGHPVVGDKKYGATGNPIKRIALHVQDILLIHPVSGQKLEFNCPIPKVMAKLTDKKVQIKKQNYESRV